MTRIFALALAALLLAAGDAHAGPIPAAIAAVATAATTAVNAITWASVASFALQTAAATGLSYIVSAIRGTPRAEVGGIRGTMDMGEIRPRSVGIGRFCTAGSRVYANTWTYPGQSSKPNEMLTMVIALSDMDMAGLDYVFIGDTRGTYSTSGHTTSSVPGYSIAEFEQGAEYYLWVKFYDGSQTSADSGLTSLFGSDPNYPWTSAMIGTGMAYAIVTLRYNQSMFPGWPTIKFEGRGAKLYDQRSDSGNGGSGSQDYTSPTTWAYSDNPVVIANNIFRGLKWKTSSGYEWIYGLKNLPVTRVPSASWFAAMNTCDTLINGISGASEKSYRCGFELMLDAEPLDAIAELAKSCNARIASVGGVYKPLVGAVGASVYSFTDDDIVLDIPQSFDQFPSLNDTINGIKASYPEPAQAWTVKDAPPLFNSTYETEDGGRRLLTNVTYNAVPYSGQVQRLMQSAVLEARKFRRHTLVLKPNALVLEPNDTVAWTSTKNSYTSKAFRVDAVDVDASLNVIVSLVECDSADYTFNTSTDYRAVQNVTIPVVTTPGIPDHPLAVLLQAKALLDTVNRRLDEIAEIGIAQTYLRSFEMPGAVAGVNAKVTEEVTLRTSEDSALAQLITTAQATADDATATALVRWVAAVAPGGVVARLALESRAEVGDDYTQAGMYLDAVDVAGNLTSMITLSADTIFLDADAGRVLLSSGGVTTALLADAAATNINYGTGSDLSSIVDDGAWHDLCTVSHTSEGSDIIVSPTALIRNDDSTTHGIYIRLVRDSTRIWPVTADTDGASQYRQSDSATVCCNVIDTPAAGTYTYKLQYKGAGSVNLKVLSPVIMTVEVKR